MGLKGVAHVVCVAIPDPTNGVGGVFGGGGHKFELFGVVFARVVCVERAHRDRKAACTGPVLLPVEGSNDLGRHGLRKGDEVAVDALLGIVFAVDGEHDVLLRAAAQSYFQRFDMVAVFQGQL